MCFFAMSLQAKIAVMEEKKGDIRQEITSMTRKLYLAEEDIKETGKTCKVLKSGELFWRC